MIRVSRGAEPRSLQLERRRRLSRAMLERQAGKASKALDFTGYGVVKEELAEALNRKCVFCEMALRPQGSPVEHFRPKALVANKGEPPDVNRYWWLAWTWENLLFACDRCNNSPYKGNQFPLAPGTMALPEGSFNLATEQPLLIDPATVDPRDHLRFKWSRSEGRWVPVPVNGSTLGKKTIEILGLDQDEKPTKHILERVEPLMEQIEEAIRGQEPAAIQRTWSRMLQSLFSRGQPFHAVTWDALDDRFPEPVRRAWGLSLPRLGSHQQPPPGLPVFEDPPEFSHLSEVVQLRVRALGQNAPWEEVKDIFSDVLQMRSWTDDELARLFERQPDTIRHYRRRLTSPSPP